LGVCDASGGWGGTPQPPRQNLGRTKTDGLTWVSNKRCRRPQQRTTTPKCLHRIVVDHGERTEHQTQQPTVRQQKTAENITTTTSRDLPHKFPMSTTAELWCGAHRRRRQKIMNLGRGRQKNEFVPPPAWRTSFSVHFVPVAK
jgi:hypothetical protein